LKKPMPLLTSCVDLRFRYILDPSSAAKPVSQPFRPLKSLGRAGVSIWQHRITLSFFISTCNALSTIGRPPMIAVLQRLAEALPRGNVAEAAGLVHQALGDGVPAETVLNQGLIAGMETVGKRFQTGEIYIPHMLLAARAMNAAIEILKPKLVESGAKPAGRVVLGTVKGDHHDIGKNLVRIMLEGSGFAVTDLGINVAPEAFVAAAGEEVQIVAMSALLSTTAPFIRETIQALEAAGVRRRVKIIIGGGVVTQAMADDFGADAYGADAASGAFKAVGLMAAWDDKKMSD
jgi:5-methyltetrahydrofolate--homocysteine methyltransferase